jgi:hypothetical protein
MIDLDLDLDLDLDTDLDLDQALARLFVEDVRRMDEAALHQAVVVDGDREAFAELMRRYDPIVRYQLWRATGGARVAATEALDLAVAEFWCALLRENFARIAGWRAPEAGEDAGASLGTWLALTAAHDAAGREARNDRARFSISLARA